MSSVGKGNGAFKDDNDSWSSLSSNKINLDNLREKEVVDKKNLFPKKGDSSGLLSAIYTNIALNDRKIQRLSNSRLQKGRRPKYSLDLLSRLEYMNMFQLLLFGALLAMLVSLISVAFLMWIEALF
jgi:hypothetical protein